MASVTVKVPTAKSTGTHPHVTITSSAGTVTLGTTDEKIDFTGLGSSWVEIPRPGTNSIARRATRNRLKAKVSAMLIDGYGGKTVEQQMLALDAISASDATVGVSYAEMANHRWHLTEATPSTIDRAFITNKTKHADVALTFLINVDEKLTVPSRSNTPASNKPKPRSKTYTVKKGDTLSRIAAKVYGNANRWPEIAKKNNIRDPRKLRVGQKLKI